MSPTRKGNQVCSAEWGLSAFLETGSINILFDSGHSEIYKNNAKHLGVNLDTADFVILSHHHWDHAKGLLHHEFKDKKKLILHPAILKKVPSEDAVVYQRDFEVITAEQPLEFSPGVFFLGEIPRKTNFESGVHGDDPMADDTAIAVVLDNGVFVLSGCAHSGIVNICEYAKQISGKSLNTVAGGFHLFEDDSAAVEGAIEYFQREKVENIYPLHCIDPPSFVQFYTKLNAIKYGTGDEITIG